jgi:hypothetical protein
MDGQHQYEINLKKDGLFINLSSDDVYFISKQMDKWFRILLDDSYIPVSLAKPQPAPQASPEPAFIPTHEATLMPVAPQPASVAPTGMAEPPQPVPVQTVPVYEQPPMPLPVQPQPQPQYQVPSQPAPPPAEYQSGYPQEYQQPQPQPAFVQPAPQPPVPQPAPQPMAAQAPMPAYAEAQAPAAQYQQPYPPQPQAPMPPLAQTPMPQPEPVAIQQPQPVVSQPAPAVYPQSQVETTQAPEIPPAAPAPLDPVVKDDFEAMMDSLMKDFESEDSASTATAVIAPNGNGNGRTENVEPAPIYSLADLCDRSQAGSSEDYLLLSAYYLTRYEQLEKFSLKRINSMLVKSGLTPVNHSVLETTLTRGYLSMVSDLTGMADVSEYTLTLEGEQAASRLL